MNALAEVTKRAIEFFNTLHYKNPKAFAQQFLAPGDNQRWPYLNVLPGAIIITDTAKLIAMHEFWFLSSETAFKPYRNGIGLDREFLTEDLQYCEFVAGTSEAIRCGANAYVIKEQNLGEENQTIIISPMHLSLVFAYDQETQNWWVTQTNNTPLPHDT